MKTKFMHRTNIWKGISGVAGFLCSTVSVMGCYPVVPAYVAAAALEQRKNVWLYIGVAAGMARFMELTAVVKYFFTVILCAAGIRFYQWANKKCSGWAAGAIAALSTLAMSISGTLLIPPDRNDLLAGLSEGVMVLGLTVLFHYLIILLPELVRLSAKEDKRANDTATMYTDSRMEAFAEAFDGLSHAFAGLSRPVPPQESSDEAGALQREITGKLCASCDGCAICWSRENQTPALRIHQMVAAVTAHKPKDEIMQKEYIAECPNYPDMVEMAVQAFSRIELNKAWYARLRENRLMIAQQLDAMADMMGEWVRGSQCLDAKYRLQLARIQLEAKDKGLIVENPHILKENPGHLYIRADVSSKWGGAIPTKNYVRAVSNAMGKPFGCAKNTRSVISTEPAEIVLYEQTKFYVLSGIASRKKDGSTINGDNFSTVTMDDGQYVVALSDGMGTGARASQESEMVVELVEKFLEAGFRKDSAVKMMNSAMVLQGENNSYSTLDLASLDLYTGKLEMTKIGAAASFIKRGEKVVCLSAPSLPAGAECEVKPGISKETLGNGDFLVMVTDGVVEYLHVKNPEKKLSEIIEEIKTENAGVLAKTIMERVMLFNGGHAMDDMTVLVTGIWDK